MNSQNKFPIPVFEKNDRNARIFIWSASIIVFIGISFLSRVKLHLSLNFDPHIFATINAGVNSIVAFLLIAGLLTVKSKNYIAHKKIMLAAISLSVLFLISYVCHHLFSGDTKYGDLNRDGILSPD